MSFILSSDFKVDNAMMLAESFSNNDNLHFLFAAQILPYESEDVVPEIQNNVQTLSIDSYRQMVFGKQIQGDDVILLIKNIPWVTGKTFIGFSQDLVDAQDKDFYCISEEQSAHHVFKCLQSPGTPSIVAPLRSQTDPEDEFYMTADGYQWKFMYSISAADYRRYATNEFFPVIPDQDVIDNASSGSIESIKIEDGGRLYNAYSQGGFNDVAVAGNNYFLSLVVDQNNVLGIFDIDSVPTGFVVDDAVQLKQGVTIIASGIINQVTTDRITVLFIGNQGNFAYTSGMKLHDGPNEVVTSGLIKQFVNPLSGNAGFYNNSAIYIRSGAGAGQVRQISEYIVTGNSRQVMIDEPFSPSPSIASTFEIAPRVLISGDGVNAQAIAKIDRFSNSISSIEILNRGADYTYADVIMTGNTGPEGSFVPAITKPILSPRGGHGSNVYSELFATSVGVTSVFEGDEHPLENDYRMIGIIKNPLFQNITIDIDVSSLTFLAGEEITTPSGFRADIATRSGATLILTNVMGIIETGDEITGTSSSTTAEVESVSRDQTLYDARTRVQMELLYTGPLEGSAFQEDELVIQESSLGRAWGYVHSYEGSIINLVDVRGNIELSDDDEDIEHTLVGQSSGAIAKVIAVTKSDIVPFSGKMLYLKQFIPVTRDDEQQERIKIVVRV